MNLKRPISRRDALKWGTAGALGILGAGLLNPRNWFGQTAKAMEGHDMKTMLSQQNHQTMAHGYDPSTVRTEGLDAAIQALTTFDYGKIGTTAEGRTVREYELIAMDTEVQIADGIKFPGWTYNGTIPGPTIRCTEGDIVRVKFWNGSVHPHSIHFHGIHPPRMDGIEPVPSGTEFIYEFEAKPAGMHLYHCHIPPLSKHIHKGLYGNFIVDPRTPRAPAMELNMVMNGYDLDLDGENEIYTVNGYAFAYQAWPIEVKVGELVRVYLSNLTEFDLINSFHLHANFFNYYEVGADPEARPVVTDTIMQCQGQRGILEIVFPEAGKYMFHAHQSEFAELGWMGFFEAKP